jgi:hypothetical protein
MMAMQNFKDLLGMLLEKNGENQSDRSCVKRENK